ncbi:MAG TPA: hypothetical protein VIV14_04085 [Gammaproteobacteria bacterium]
MKRILPSLMFLAAACGAVAQEMPLTIEGLAQRNARLLVAGVAYGLFAVDAELDSAGSSPLYCPPDGVEISGNYLWDLADAELDGDQDLLTVAETVLRRLRALYPCDQ